MQHVEDAKEQRQAPRLKVRGAKLAGTSIRWNARQALLQSLCRAAAQFYSVITRNDIGKRLAGVRLAQPQAVGSSLIAKNKVPAIRQQTVIENMRPMIGVDWRSVPGPRRCSVQYDGRGEKVRTPKRGLAISANQRCTGKSSGPKGGPSPPLQHVRLEQSGPA